MMNNQTENTEVTPANPSQDGVSHINVHYNCGRTKLGRMLSTYFVANFTHPYFGPFKCIEGLLLYLRTGGLDDAYRTLTGAKAKAYFRKQVEGGKAKIFTIPNEEQLLITANQAKFKFNPVIETLFKESTEPFDVYYLHGPGNIPVRPSDSAPMINALTVLRTAMKRGDALTPLTNEDYARMRIAV